MRSGGGGGGGRTHHRLMSAAKEHTPFKYLNTRKCIQLSQFINIYLYLYRYLYSYISLYNSIELYKVSLPHLGDLPYSTAMSNAHRERFFNV